MNDSGYYFVPISRLTRIINIIKIKYLKKKKHYELSIQYIPIICITTSKEKITLY